jgi:3-oxoacyl-[acyl-carrier protein] reductase
MSPSVFTVDLSGRSAIVTGGSRGIGLSAAKFLVRAGCQVAIVYRRRQREARRACLELEALGGPGLAFRADVSDEKEAKRAIAQAIARMGGLHILINNAGIWPGGAVEEISPSYWEEVFAINVRGTFLMTKFAVPIFKKQKFGRIVNVSSTAGQRGEPYHSHYAASKGAVISFTKSLAGELGPFGITVNAVAPGWVDTEMSQRELGDKRRRRAIEQEVPTGRVSTADDIGSVIAFLCSDYAQQINGEIVNINGGSVLVG